MKIKKTKKKWIHRIAIIILVLVAFWFVSGIYILNHKSSDDLLKEKGYTTGEIVELKKYLDSRSFDTLLKYSYQKNVTELIKEPDFKEAKLSEYITFLTKYQTAKLSDVIFLVNNNQQNIAYSPDISNIINHEEFNLSNLDRYLSYYNKYELEANITVLAVKYNLDEDDIELDETIALFLGKTYSLNRNLDRYKNYYNKNQTLNIEEVIKRVNSNLDKAAYKDVIAVDLTKGDLLLANKYHYLENNYVPKNLVNIDSQMGKGQLENVAYTAFISMYNDAKKENLFLYISSAYRSYQTQKNLYTNYVSKDGQKNADTYSARPGYSEHQTGLAIDLGTATNRNINDFEKSDEFKWMKKNAHKYGFILRYPLGQEYITGYMYEPWHYRYVGTEVANYINEKKITYDEYYEYFVK